MKRLKKAERNTKDRLEARYNRQTYRNYESEKTDNPPGS
jgi:hypothetical protein